MNIFNLLKSCVKRTSIRHKLLQSFLLTSTIIAVVMLFVIVIVASVVGSVAVSYKTNVNLDLYSNLLAEIENSLEQYMQLRSFESIDSYYNYRSKLEEWTSEFPQKPSLEKTCQLEYTITQFVHTFLYYADNAVVYRRANNVGASDISYYNAMKVYNLISEAVSELNTIYFRGNIVKYNQSLSNIKKVSCGCFLIVVLVIILNIVLVYAMITRITNPLVEISGVAHRLAEREFDIPLLEISSQDEVGNICRAFNRMIISIREYIDTIWEKAVHENELREKEMKMTELYQEAQLKALQAQINPHFLFNTLNTGAQLAMMEGADKTCFFIEQVADFFRYNIQQIDRDTTLEDEIHIVDNYVYIMNVRFGSKFKYIKNISYSNHSLRMPSMILQPLVENCIRHGLYEVSSGGIVMLDVKEEDGFTVISITDNGCGFPPEKKTELLSKPGVVEISKTDIREDKSIGLANVVERLKIYFNTDDVFDILSPAPVCLDGGPGTCFVIRIKNV